MNYKEIKNIIIVLLKIRRFLSTSKKITEETQYFKLIENALNGDVIKSRNGITYNSFGESMKLIKG